VVVDAALSVIKMSSVDKPTSEKPHSESHTLESKKL
jgi:hypothetical protein